MTLIFPRSWNSCSRKSRKKGNKTITCGCATSMVFKPNKKKPATIHFVQFHVFHQSGFWNLDWLKLSQVGVHLLPMGWRNLTKRSNRNKIGMEAMRKKDIETLRQKNLAA